MGEKKGDQSIHPHLEKGEKQQDVPEKYTRVKGNGSIAFSSARRNGKREYGKLEKRENREEEEEEEKEDEGVCTYSYVRHRRLYFLESQHREKEGIE